ncbi:MAG: bis(5'-nucleosyl)-tetraphosphatase (symmetrical) YqeK [Bulleidia sp.]
MIVEGTFDPITVSEVQEVLNLRKQSGIRDIHVQVSKDGVLDEKTRTAVVKLAFAPYRHVHVCENRRADQILTGYEEQEKQARSGYFRLCQKPVRRYLIEHNCYLPQIVQANCRPKRAVHSKGVADTCVILAHAHGLDETTAQRMGYLHDITKAMSEEQSADILKVWSPADLHLAPPIWHSRTAVVWLKQNMGLYDPEILNPIWNHTLGEGKSDYDRILYIADKIEPNRNYDTTYHLALACRDLRAAMEYVKKEGEEYRRKESGKQ